MVGLEGGTVEDEVDSIYLVGNYAPYILWTSLMISDILCMNFEFGMPSRS